MSTPLPPGRLGLPYLGETLALLRNPFRFLEERQARYGDVFKSRILGRTTVFLAGRAGAETFYDSGAISRSDAHPYTITDLFGGLNFEMYDGPRHVALKEIALTAFDLDAIAGYLPALQGLIEQRLAQWARQPEFSATAELRKLAIEAICLNVLGLEPSARTDVICRDYGRVLKGIVSPPLPIPGTPYGKARAARDRLLATIREIVAERRAAPGADGLSRMLTGQSPDGRRFSDEEAVLEGHHIVIAGFIVYALMGEVLRRLAEDRELAAACREEVGDGDVPLSLDRLRRLETSNRVVLEAKRIVPAVPLAFGRAERDFTCGEFRVCADWRVYLALHLCNTDPAVYQAPRTFDADRFGPDRSEQLTHPLAFIPQGAGPPTGHQCLGLEYSTSLVLAFLAVAVRGYEWELPPQDFAYRWSTIPPEPRDGLRVALRARAR